MGFVLSYPHILNIWIPKYLGNGILNFCEIGAHAKFPSPKTTPSGRKDSGGYERREKNLR